MSPAALSLYPDRLLPAEPGVRRLARELYDTVRELPILSPHGHVPAAWLADDVRFADPTSLLITPDHYVTRLLHASGVALSELGVGQGQLSERQSRQAFRTVCVHWSAYRGTPVRFWFDAQLAGIFGITQRPSEETADDIYDQIADCLATPEFRARALCDRFGIEVLATTDDPCDDGLVMTLHPGVRRNHHGPTFDQYGTDVGTDIPIRVEFTDALRPLLERFGTHPGFQLVVFTLDETAFSREIAPLAGCYPSVYAGAPWWFLDAPEAIRRYRAAVTESAGFAKTSGFIDDTRAFCSIPTRHDMSRRLDAGYLAQLVAEHRLDDDEAVETLHDLVVANPRRAFKL